MPRFEKKCLSSDNLLEDRVTERTIELERSNAFLETLIEQLPKGIMVAEPPDCQIVLANKAAKEIDGFHFNQLSPKDGIAKQEEMQRILKEV
jgi:nitrogen fixation/metabolism regulation signal transduction histidine kinase